MVGGRQSTVFRTDRDRYGRQLAPSDREKLLQPYLPSEPIPRGQTTTKVSSSDLQFHHRQRFRPAVRHLLHLLIFHVIHALFSTYVWLRQLYHSLYYRILAVAYYHHRTPELIKRDVKNLGRLPTHLSVILELPQEEGKKDGLETLLNDVCELTAWTASAGIPLLSIYEQTGNLLTLPDGRNPH